METPPEDRVDPWQQFTDNDDSDSSYNLDEKRKKITHDACVMPWTFTPEVGDEHAQKSSELFAPFQ